MVTSLGGLPSLHLCLSFYTYGPSLCDFVLHPLLSPGLGSPRSNVRSVILYRWKVAI